MEVVALIMIGSIVAGGIWGVVADHIREARFLKSDEYRVIQQRNAATSELLKKRMDGEV